MINKLVFSGLAVASVASLMLANPASAVTKQSSVTTTGGSSAMTGHTTTKTSATKTTGGNSAMTGHTTTKTSATKTTGGNSAMTGHTTTKTSAIQPQQKTTHTKATTTSSSQ